MTATTSVRHVDSAPRRERKLVLVAECAVVLLLFVADVYRWIPVSKTPFLFALGWLTMRLRGVSWHSVGWARPRNWGRALAVGVLAGSGMALLELVGTDPLFSCLIGRPPDLSDFHPLTGNLSLLLVGLFIVWLVAALGEELVYRGYLMNRVADVAKETRRPWLVSLILVSALFGASHIDQGITGMLENAIAGFLLGGLYLASGRNLATPIVAHGVQDTIDLVLIYLGKYPRM